MFITDVATHYFLLLVRHGDKVVFTQMVSTHDAAEVKAAGTLDVPNVIKLSDITRTFRLELEVYGMVSERRHGIRVFYERMRPSYTCTSPLCPIVFASCTST